MTKTTKKITPAKFEAALRSWLMLQGGGQDAPIDVCEGATLEAVGRSVWEVQDLAEHGRLGPELGPYLARVSGPARNGRPVADHEIRFLHQSDGYIYGVVSLGEVGCYSVLILAFRRNGVVTAATKVALRPLLAIAEKIAWERLAELTRTVKEGDETCG